MHYGNCCAHCLWKLELVVVGAVTPGTLAHVCWRACVPIPSCLLPFLPGHLCINACIWSFHPQLNCDLSTRTTPTATTSPPPRSSLAPLGGPGRNGSPLKPQLAQPVSPLASLHSAREEAGEDSAQAWGIVHSRKALDSEHGTLGLPPGALEAGLAHATPQRWGANAARGKGGKGERQGKDGEHGVSTLQPPLQPQQLQHQPQQGGIGGGRMKSTAKVYKRHSASLKSDLDKEAEVRQARLLTPLESPLTMATVCRRRCRGRGGGERHVVGLDCASTHEKVLGWGWHGRQ